MCFILLVGLLPHLCAQQPQDPMTPSLALSFPLQQAKDFVTVKYPVLMNPNQNGIIRPGTQLITIFQITAPTSFNQTVVQHGNAEAAYSRDTRSSQEKAEMPEDVAQGINHAITSPWLVTNNFVLALAQFPPDQALIITKKMTGTISRTENHSFSFFDGLFLGAPGGKVTIISVENVSPAGDAGLKAGDIITSVGGLPVPSLETFVASYSKTKEDASTRHKPNYIVSILRDGAPLDIKVAMPPRFDFDSN
jgi:C-terminal processing protease CtpA/Prc